MKRLTVLVAFLISSALLLAACGGGSSSGSATTTGASSGASSSGGAVSAGASGIKDATLIGKWISADGGVGYDFKDDFNVTVTAVGEDVKSSYNITVGGKGSGKVEIMESGAKVVWDYKITDDRLELTTPEGRSRRLKKTQ
jgi:hypothetical protein